MQSCASADGPASAAVVEQGGQGDELRGLPWQNPDAPAVGGVSTVLLRDGHA